MACNAGSASSTEARPTIHAGFPAGIVIFILVSLGTYKLIPIFRHPEVRAKGAPRRMYGRGARAGTPAKSGLPDFGLSSVQVGYSRLGWLAALAPQGDGIEGCRHAGRGATPCRQITLGVAARCRVLRKNCNRPRAA